MRCNVVTKRIRKTRNKKKKLEGHNCVLNVQVLFT